MHTLARAVWLMTSSVMLFAAATAPVGAQPPGPGGRPGPMPRGPGGGGVVGVGGAAHAGGAEDLVVSVATQAARIEVAALGQL